VNSLVKMANYAMHRFHGSLVGVVGSVRKTITKSMITLALEAVVEN
jgi:UDP-N-acetylmuramyl pentapeptide synthase